MIGKAEVIVVIVLRSEVTLVNLDLAFVVAVGGRGAEEVDGMDVQLRRIAGFQERSIKLGGDLDAVGYELFDPEGLSSQQDVIRGIYFEGIAASDG